MSYHQPNPTYYQTFQPDTPFHPGAEGWTKAPWVTWGDNPNLAGRRKLATDGLGKVIAISGLGAISLGPAPEPGAASMPLLAPVPAWRQALGTVSAAACAYHGYKRNDSVGWAVGWAFFGSLAPFLALPIALAQGYGKPAPRAAMATNRRLTPNPHRRARRR